MSSFWISLVLGLVIGSNFTGKSGFLAAVIYFAFGCFVGGSVLSIRLLRGLSTPLDLLPNLDNDPARGPSESHPMEAQPAQTRNVRLAVILGLGAALTVAALVSTVTLAILPASFMSMARIQVIKAPGQAENDLGAFDPYFVQTEAEVIRSHAVLDSVVERLNLPARWASDSLPAAR